MSVLGLEFFLEKNSLYCGSALFFNLFLLAPWREDTTTSKPYSILIKFIKKCLNGYKVLQAINPPEKEKREKKEKKKEKKKPVEKVRQETKESEK